MGQTGDPQDAVEIIRSTRPHLVILDLALREAHGLEVIKDLRARVPDLHILVLSMHDESIYAERVVRAGARGYIMKGEPTERVLAAVRHVLSGRIWLSEAMTNRLLEKATRGEPVSDVESLSDRELEVFELMGDGLSTSQIAGALSLSPRTIETHRDNIKAKLGVRNARELIQRAALWSKSRGLPGA